MKKNDEPQWKSPKTSPRPDSIPIPEANATEKASLNATKLAGEQIGSNQVSP